MRVADPLRFPHAGRYVGFLFARRKERTETTMNKQLTRKLTESAVMIALGTILSILKIDLPFGGGVTIGSMLPLVLISHRWGWKWGTLTAFVYSGIQLLLGLDNVGYATTFATAAGVVVLDYLLAYTVIGLSGIFDRPCGKTLKSIMVGIAVTFTLRFLCHLITGVWIWGGWMPETFMNLTMTSPWLYSFLYNGWYMLAELIVSEILIVLLYQPLAPFLRREDRKS